MPYQERNEEYQGDNDEEWQAGNSGGLPGMRYQDVQDRQVVLGLII